MCHSQVIVKFSHSMALFLSLKVLETDNCKG